VWLVYDLPSKDRLSAVRVHLHPFERHNVGIAELVTHQYR
jgi:hypothetical protein